LSKEKFGENLGKIMSITYRPRKKRTSKRKYGFLKRKKTKSGKKVLKRRRKKGRWRISPV